MDQLCSIGDAFFYIPYLNNDPNANTAGLETIQTVTQATWVSQQRLSRAPAMQYLGPGNKSITIAGRLYPKSFGGLGTLSQLEALSVAGKPLPFIRYTLGSQQAQGTVNGDNYVIMGIQKAEQKISSDGVPFRVDFSLELMRYGDDQQKAGGSFIIQIQ
jgi:uncharacterized protein